MPETTLPSELRLNRFRGPQCRFSMRPKPCQLPCGQSPQHADTPAPSGFRCRWSLFPYFGFGAMFNQPEQGLSQCSGLRHINSCQPQSSGHCSPVLPKMSYKTRPNFRTSSPRFYAPMEGFYYAVNPHHWLDRSSTCCCSTNHDHGRARQRYQSRGSCSESFL